MVSKIRFVCVGLMICCLIFAGQAFTQEVQIVPVQSAPAAPAAPTGAAVGPAAPVAPVAAGAPMAPGIPGPMGAPGSVGGTTASTAPAAPFVTQGAVPPGQAPGAPAPVSTMPGYIPPGATSAAPAVPPAAAEAPGGGEGLSSFEQYISGKAPTTISFDIKQFGYDLFKLPAPPASTTPGVPAPAVPPAAILDMPVNPDYLIGPGDEVRLSIWGSFETSLALQVDRDGNITLPRAGVLPVAGLTFQQLKEVIQKELAKYFTDFQMNVTMGPLKTMRVYLVGNAKAPGSYTVSSLSTVIGALVASGGPTKTGSLRDIQLKRDNQVITHLDLYDLLLKGDKSKDVRLMPEDVIFIPPVGPIVGVAGNVEIPAIYEMKGKIRLSEAIKMAGGPMADAYLSRVQVERVFQSRTKNILDLNLQSVKGKEDITLENGDIVKVFPIVSMVVNKVILKGNVQRPGDYEWKQGLRVRDIIKSKEALLPDSLLDYAVIERLALPDYHQEYKTFSLDGLLFKNDEKENILLQPYDTITVLNKWDIIQKERVRITGAVNKPGDFEYRPNMKLSDLLKLGGGLRKFAFTRTAELTRVTPTQEGPKTEQIYVSPSEALAGNPQYDIPLKEDDYLFVRSVPDWQLYRKVNVSGEFKFPGDFALQKGEKLSSLILRAGGFTDKVYLRGATFFRQSVKDLQQKNINDMIDRLDREIMATGSADASSQLTPDEAAIDATAARQKKIFIDSLRQVRAQGRMVIKLDEPDRLKGTPYDLELEDGDMVFVPSNPHTIQVLGAVNNQSNFIYLSKKDYSYYVNLSGGYTDTADSGKTYVVKVDGTALKPGGGFFWNSGSHTWGDGASSLLEPGDTIVVPYRLEKTAWLRNVKDITQVLYQIATTAGVAMIGLK